MPRVPTTLMQREQKRQRLLHLARFVSNILSEYELSALQFAKLSGIPKSTVYTILSADHEPTAANMRKLALALSQLTDKRITRDYLESLIDETATLLNGGNPPTGKQSPTAGNPPKVLSHRTQVAFQEGATTDSISNSEEKEQSRAVDLIPSVESQDG